MRLRSGRFLNSENMSSRNQNNNSSDSGNGMNGGQRPDTMASTSSQSVNVSEPVITQSAVPVLVTETGNTRNVDIPVNNERLMIGGMSANVAQNLPNIFASQPLFQPSRPVLNPPWGMPSHTGGQNGTVMGSTSTTSSRQDNSGIPRPINGRQNPANVVGLSEDTLSSVRHQMDASNHDMVHMVTQQMGTILNPLVENNSNACLALANEIKRLNRALGVEVPENGQNFNQPLNRLLNSTNNVRQPQVEMGNVEQNFENVNRQPPLRYGNVQILQPENERINPRALDVLRNNAMNNNVNQAVEEALTRYGLNIGHTIQPYFVSAFPDWVQQAEMPRGMKVPKLSKFSGDSGESTVEHIARYTIELGELALDEGLRMRLFPSSLTKNAFSWFSTLRPNSIHGWNQLERSFHDQFFRGDLKVGLTDLLNVKRMTGETIDDYLARFRQMRSRCFTPIPEPEVIKIAVMGLDYYVRKKLVNQQLIDLAQLADKVRQIEQLKSEKWNNKKKFLKREKVNMVGYESDDSQNSDVNCEVDIVELKSGPPYQCHALKPSKGKILMPYVNKKNYTFDISKSDQIFDILLKDKQIKLSDDHKLLKSHEIGDRKYCKFHNSFGHVLNDCYHFRDMIQKGIVEGRLKFAEKPTMKVDTEPFGPDQGSNNKKPVFNVGMVDVKGKGMQNPNKTDSAEVFPKENESVTEFFNRRADKGIIKICPKCETFFDNTAAEKDKQQVMFDKRRKEESWRSAKRAFWTGESSHNSRYGKTNFRPNVWSRMRVPPSNIRPNTWYRNDKNYSRPVTHEYQWQKKESIKGKTQAVDNKVDQSVPKPSGFSSKTEKRRRQRMRQAEKKRAMKQMQNQNLVPVETNPNIKKVEQKSPP